ncbi:MAG: leucine-rich repeat domain-containing protein [Acetatifactor sp.]|nr:leucine-rich repeat domain-containing protein [Acetatifactor sp.]
MMGVLSNYYSSIVKRIMCFGKCSIGVIVLLPIMGIIVWAAEGETETRENPYYMVTAEGEIIITGSPNQEEIIIPAEIDGMPVVGIAENAFLNRNDIKKVTIRSGVRYVGEYAFAGCETLKAVTLDNGLQYIGKGAFSGDSILKEIWIPDSVAFIGENAFGDCIELETIKFPQTAHVDDYAFEGSRWQELRDEGDFRIRGSCLISARGNERGSLEIPYGVTRTIDNPSASGYVRAVVGQYMAYGDNIQYEEIILPETMVH